MLPESNLNERVDDLNEVPLYIEDLNNNGFLEAGERVLFYAQGPHTWSFPSSVAVHNYNRYDEKAFYFLSVSNSNAIPGSPKELVKYLHQMKSPQKF